MNLQTAQIDEIIKYLRMNPAPPPAEVREIFLNLARQLASLESQAKMPNPATGFSKNPPEN